MCLVQGLDRQHVDWNAGEKKKGDETVFSTEHMGKK